MNLIAVSINHHTAPVEQREALFFSDEEIRSFIQKVKGKFLSEGLVISTCNRTEVYGIPIDPKLSYGDIQKLIIDFKPVKNISPEHFNNFYSCASVKHLFSVISGIDSLLIGDNQIYSQVRDAFLISEEMQFSKLLMKKVFDSAIKTGKRSITETKISEGAVTVSFAAVQLIEKIFSNLSKKTALVIGAGETGEIAAKHLKERGIGKLTITNRTLERAENTARKLGAEIILFDNLKENLHKYDIIISAISSENILISKADIGSAMKKRNFSDMVLMDISVPRNIDPASKEIDYVFYNDIDSLNIIVEQNLAKRKEEIPKVEKIVEEETDNFFKWYNSLEAAPAIKNLHEYFEKIRAEEVNKNKNRFNSEDQEKLEIVTKRIINKILHNPTIELKKMSGDSGYDTAIKIKILRELFGFDKKETNNEK